MNRTRRKKQQMNKTSRKKKQMDKTSRKKQQMTGGASTYINLHEDLKKIFNILSNKYTIKENIINKNTTNPPSLYDNEDNIIKNYYYKWVQNRPTQATINSTLTEFDIFNLTNEGTDVIPTGQLYTDTINSKQSFNKGIIYLNDTIKKFDKDENIKYMFLSAASKNYKCNQADFNNRYKMHIIKLAFILINNKRILLTKKKEMIQNVLIQIKNCDTTMFDDLIFKDSKEIFNTIIKMLPPINDPNAITKIKGSLHQLTSKIQKTNQEYLGKGFIFPENSKKKSSITQTDIISELTTLINTITYNINISDNKTTNIVVLKNKCLNVIIDKIKHILIFIEKNTEFSKKEIKKMISEIEVEEIFKTEFNALLDNVRSNILHYNDMSEYFVSSNEIIRTVNSNPVSKWWLENPYIITGTGILLNIAYSNSSKAYSNSSSMDQISSTVLNNLFSEATKYFLPLFGLLINAAGTLFYHNVYKSDWWQTRQSRLTELYKVRSIKDANNNNKSCDWSSKKTEYLQRFFNAHNLITKYEMECKQNYDDYLPLLKDHILCQQIICGNMAPEEIEQVAVAAEVPVFEGPLTTVDPDKFIEILNTLTPTISKQLFINLKNYYIVKQINSTITTYNIIDSTNAEIKRELIDYFVKKKYEGDFQDLASVINAIDDNNKTLTKSILQNSGAVEPVALQEQGLN